MSVTRLMPSQLRSNVESTAAAPTPPQRPAAAPTSDAAYDRLFASRAALPNLRGLVPNQAQPSAASAALAPTRAGRSALTDKMDALERRFSGPFQVEEQGVAVAAPPMFHSNYSPKEQLRADPRAHRFAVQVCNTKELRTALQACMIGRPSPEQLTRVTQALLDAGGLNQIVDELGKPVDLERPIEAYGIRKMQEYFCIGIDCIGFVRQNQIALRGATPFQNDARMGGCTAQLHASKLFTQRPLSEAGRAKPGDTIHLAPDGPGGRQHNVMVRSNEPVHVSDPRRATLVQKLGGDHRLLQGDGLRMIEISCSGGGEIDHGRGVRRETWLYNEQSQTWGTVNGEGEVIVHPEGPDGHATGFLFTAKSSPS